MQIVYQTKPSSDNPITIKMESSIEWSRSVWHLSWGEHG